MTDKIKLDETDKRLLRTVQDSFPLSLDPWREIGEKVGLPREEVLVRLRELKEKGVIKRIAPVIESRGLGLASSTLVLMRVPTSRLEYVARIVNGYEGVTHNYQRNGDFNLWFTLRGRDRNELDAVVNDIMEKTGTVSADIVELPTTRRFKVGVRFAIE